MKLICYLSILIFFLLSFVSCEKDYYSNKGVEITTPVSFANDIMPILTEDCATPACHVAGGPPPDLSPAVAYDQLTGLGYVDTTNAEQSLLYVRITSTTNPMPPGQKLTPDEIGYILAWIKQGAQNN